MHSNIITATTIPPVTLNRSYIVLVSIISALGGLLFGFDTAIISGTISYIQPYFQLNEFSLGWAVSSILLGCAAGAVLAGKLSDNWGRKTTLMFCAFLFAATGVGTGLAHSLPLFVLCRILGGLAVGTAAMVAPMYIAETVPASLRGRMVALYQLAIVTGILMAYLSNYLLSGIGENNWRWMFASQAFPSALFFLLLFFVPESPRWLVKKERINEAKNILEKVGGSEHCLTELAAIEESFQHETKEKLSALWLPSYRPVLWMGIIIAVFQQITGINAILYYAPEIFKYTGVSNENALLQTIGIGVMMFLFTLVAIWLVDKAGRRILLLVGCALMGLSLIGVATCFHFSYYDHYFVLIFLMLYIAGFSALHDTQMIATNLTRFAQRNYVYTGLVTSHNPDHAIYNLDAVLSLQRLLSEMLVFSQPGRIELLPAYPKDFPNGQLSGLRIHGGHKIDLSWSNGQLKSVTVYPGKTGSCELVYGSNAKSIRVVAGMKYVLDKQFRPISKN